jgi:hypothetical protein
MEQGIFFVEQGILSSEQATLKREQAILEPRYVSQFVAGELRDLIRGVICRDEPFKGFPYLYIITQRYGK